MKKLILKSFLSPGDIVMLTAAVRDLHRCYPHRFTTDVRTRCPELWENNPYLTALSETDPEVEFIECAYPLINRCNEAPYHCLHGYIDFLNRRLDLAIKPTLFSGDIHISELEKSWYSQVHEVTRCDVPFWIVIAGGKYDVTIKWWDMKRFQEVVNHFRGKIQFVQVGEFGHHHPRLSGVIDLRGQTNLRELVRLVYHAQGVLCPVTALMHLAAAVPVKGQTTSSKAPHSGNRACVVIAGGREPAHWEQYPGHQFIHTIGSLPCCASGGCWKDRILPLGDGDERDQEAHLCVNRSGNLPRCMDMITTTEVIRRIELYFDGGWMRYLSASEQKAGRSGVKATRRNAFDSQALNLHEAPQACERFLQTIPDYPGSFQGRGIVICGGGLEYFTNAWVCIKMLRRLGCWLPIQLWFLGKEEMDRKMKVLLEALKVTCIDALKVRQSHPARILKGWELKAYAILHCSFREVLFLDADNVPVRNPAFLFESQQFRATGAIFWPDYGQFKKTQVIWDNSGLQRPDGPEFESGQMLLDKKRCWRALCLAMWFNENSDFYYQHLHGDKETFHLAFEKLVKSYVLVPTPIHSLEGTMCQHDFNGGRLFQHRNTDKWNFLLRNRQVKGFWFEEECRDYVRELQTVWDGRMSTVGGSCAKREHIGANSRELRRGQSLLRSVPTIQACMISCAERESVRKRTLASLAASDLDGIPLHIEMDNVPGEDRRARQTLISYRALCQGAKSGKDYILFLEDDLQFNRFFLKNLAHWPPLTKGRITLAGLYNPGLKAVACDVASNAWVIAPEAIFGSQAFLLSRAAVKFIVRHWDEISEMQDIRISRLAGRLGKPIFYHSPSLVQHVGAKSVWGGQFHRACDYDAQWKAQKL